jgi:hypothetical protein
MPWTDPTEWEIGDVITEERLNEEIRDNLLVLKSMPHVEYLGPLLTKGIASGSFINIDATYLNFNLTVEWDNAIVEIGLVASGGWSGSGGTLWTDVEVDGTRIGDATNGLAATSAAVYAGNVGFTAIVTGLTQGVHTFKAQFKCGSGGIMVRQFWVRQVG